MRSSSTLPKQRKPRSSSGWSAERRANHAAAIRRWSPWANSTGPRTIEGKARSSLNALKHGARSAGAKRLNGLFRRHRAYLRWVVSDIKKMQKSTNELLKAHRIPRKSFPPARVSTRLTPLRKSIYRLE